MITRSERERDAQDIAEARRALRIIFRRLAALFLIGDTNTDGERASGDVPCADCGNVYRLHVQHPHAPWMTVLCDGRRVKL